MLQGVATLIRQHIRESDTLCRWGGEEFLLLLDHCTLDDAVERANRIREAVKTHSIAFGKTSIRVTLSMGATDYRQGESLEMFLARADAALYQAKAQGRDQVIRAD